jgi:hypothetical protein
VNKDSWREFNDDDNKYFAFSDLGKEAFGNEVSNFSQRESSGKSAYMLVYERKQKTSIRQISCEDKSEQLLPYKSIEPTVPEWLSSEVKKDNMDFVIDRLVFDDNFFVMCR